MSQNLITRHWLFLLYRYLRAMSGSCCWSALRPAARPECCRRWAWLPFCYVESFHSWVRLVKMISGCQDIISFHCCCSPIKQFFVAICIATCCWDQQKNAGKRETIIWNCISPLISGVLSGFTLQLLNRTFVIEFHSLIQKYRIIYYQVMILAYEAHRGLCVMFCNQLHCNIQNSYNQTNN